MSDDTKLRVSVTIVGMIPLEYSINPKTIGAIKSSLFEIVDVSVIRSIDNSDLPNWSYSDKFFDQLNYTRSSNKSAFHIIITYVPLQDNYYMRRLSDNKAVLSIFEMADIFTASGYSVVDFLKRSLLQAVSTYYKFDRVVPPNSSGVSTSHVQLRGCIFDKVPIKRQILQSMHNFEICSECQGKIDGKFTPAGFYSLISKELKSIKPPLFFRIAKFVKQNIVLSILIAAIFTILINVSSNYIYEYFAKRVINDGLSAVMPITKTERPN